MSISQAEMVRKESDRLYSAINTYNNILPAQFDALLRGYGINPQAMSLAHLTDAQKGELLKFATDFYLAIIKEMLSGSVYTNLRSTGFNEPVFDSAIVYVEVLLTSNLPEDSDWRIFGSIIHKNLSKTKELFDTVFTQFSGYAPPTQQDYTDISITDLLGRVAIIKNKLVAVAPDFNKVG